MKRVYSEILLLKVLITKDRKLINELPNGQTLWLISLANNVH